MKDLLLGYGHHGHNATYRVHAQPPAAADEPVTSTADEDMRDHPLGYEKERVK
jgi:hypothetical protein